LRHDIRAQPTQEEAVEKKMPAYVYWFEMSSFDGKSVQVILVEPNVKGYTPTNKRVEAKSIEEAEKTIFEMNAKEGHTKLEVDAAVASSMFPTSYARYILVHEKIELEKAQAVAHLN
jgi:hypothetical protein